MTLFSRESTEPKPFWFRKICINFLYYQYKVYGFIKKFLRKYMPIVYTYVFSHSLIRNK